MAAPDGTTARPPRRRPWAAFVLGLIDGLVVAGLPLALLVVVGVVGWLSIGGAGSWTAGVVAGAVAWLIGHGVDVGFTAGRIGFSVTVAALGPALVSAAGAFIAGRRVARTALPGVAVGVAALVTGVIGAAVSWLATADGITPSGWQSIVLPAAVVLVAGVLGLRSAGPVPIGLRVGAATVAILVGVVALATAVLIAVHLGDGIGAMEAVGAGAGGGFALTVAQLLALPTVLVWGVAWSTGAGFALGTGTAVGPLGTDLGALPPVPLLTAVPADPPPWAALVLLLPVAAGVLAGVAGGRAAPRTGALRIAIGGGVTAAVTVAIAAAAASGAAGPGRFAEVGPNPLLVGALVLLETVPGIAAGAAMGIRSRAERPGPSWLEPGETGPAGR